jgi:cytochrome c5
MRIFCGLLALLGAGSILAADPRLALGEKIFTANCKSCHETGKAQNDAPQLADGSEWRQRLAGGKEALYKNSIAGVTGYYVMPAKGGNAALSDDEVKAAVDYIVERAGVR